jgi:ADP-heptose:LPS heptosyltransferase
MDLEEEIKKNAKINCLHFKGYMPCEFHKETGITCEDCKDYKESGKKILIIKLGAAGEVIRNTPLLRKIKQEYTNPKIFWLTEYPELLPKKEIYKICNFNNKELELIRNIEFDVLYSLDKHEETGALANQINAKIKKGFSQKDGAFIPFDDDSLDKWKTGFRNDLMKENKKHYVEEIFEICGFEFNNEKYILPEYNVPKVDINHDKKIIAINTGANEKRWKPRIYSEKRNIELSKLLLKEGYEVMLVGGPQEDEKNKRISKETGAKYFGTFDYKNFIGLLSLSDAVITPVTFTLHAAIGLEKKIVLLNNVFNKNEFYLYGKGSILEPGLACLKCYKDEFDKKCPLENCLDLIEPKSIVQEINKFYN